MAKALAILTLWLCIAFSAFAATADKKQPDWSQLTPDQQRVLAPLAEDWKNLDDRRRKKWLLTAKRYPTMKPEEQQRLQTQMQDWIKLTPQQRRVARENYKKLAKQPPEKREVVRKKWDEYQKQKQAASAPPVAGAQPPTQPPAPTAGIENPAPQPTATAR